MKVHFICGDYQAFLKSPLSQEQPVNSWPANEKTSREIYTDACVYLRGLSNDKGLTDYWIFTNSELFFYALRYRILTGHIYYAEVEIFFFQNDAIYPIKLTMDKRGHPSKWLHDFFDGFDVALGDILQPEFRR